MTRSLASLCLALLIGLSAARCNRTRPTPLPPVESQDVVKAPDDKKEPDVTQPDSSGEAEVQPPARIEQDRYQKDLTFIAAPRPPGSVHWQAVQDLCKKRLQKLGYHVQLQPFGAGAKLPGTNVIGVRKGTKAPSEQVILSAHYDSTDAVCEGADDNGSGVAGLLEAARVLASQSADRTLLIACWDQEENGLVGSRSYASEARKQNADIKMAFVFEMIGYASQKSDSQTVPLGFAQIFPEAIQSVKANDMRGDFIALAVDDSAEAAAAATALLAESKSLSLPAITLKLAGALKNSPMLNDLRRSDHAAFWEQDYPAMMITDTANFRNTHYHCAQGPDSVERLDPVFASKVVAGTVAAVRELLRVP